jgi:hypothetical protein
MGYYGMGTPIGSPHFVEEYYNEQLTTVQSAMHSLTNSIIDPQPLPTYSTLIAHLNIKDGGLGILNASHWAAPDFVINMASCIRRIKHGFIVNNDISIADLFYTNTNTSSMCLQHYHQLLPHIATICSGPTCPHQDQIHHFENNISPHSARDRIKSHCGSVTVSQIYNDVHRKRRQHPPTP